MSYDLANGFRTAVSQETLDWLETIVAGCMNAIYGDVMICVKTD